jgi:hypothetical protein
MRSHVKLATAAIVLSISTFSTARADRIRTDQVAPMLDSITNEHSLHATKSPANPTLPESLNSDSRADGCVFSFAQGVRSSAKDIGALSTERRREDDGRMHLPGFVVSIPEPMTIVLMATGLLGVVGVVRRRI